MSSEVRSRKRLEVDIDDEVLEMIRWSSRITWLSFGLFFLVILVGTVGGTRLAGIPGGIFVGGGLFLIGGRSILEVRSTGRFVTDEAPETVREELTGLVNPFTESWFVAADDSFEATSSDDGDAILILYRSTRLQSTRAVPLWVTERDDGDIHIQIGDTKALLSARLSIEPADGNTFVTAEVHRGSLPGYALLPFWLNRLSARRRFRHYGYRIVEDEGSIGLSR